MWQKTWSVQIVGGAYLRFHNILCLQASCPSCLPRRLRKSIQVFPPGSMDRHQRRVAVLAACRAIMAGRAEHPAGSTGVAGCCSPFAFETALSMLEVEHEVVVGAASNSSHVKVMIEGAWWARAPGCG